MDAAVTADRLAGLEAKLDAVSHQLEYVAAALREQETRREMWDELRRDLAPVTAEALDRVSRELDDVRAFVEPSGLLRMVKRLLRDLPYLEALLDQVESLSLLGADLSPLGREILTAAMRGLADYEERGYFRVLRGLGPVFDQMVASLDPPTIADLTAAVPGAMATVKALAHPDTVGTLQNVVEALQAPPEEKSLFRLLWQLRRPAARRGLARALRVVEALGGAEPSPSSTTPAS